MIIATGWESIAMKYENKIRVAKKNDLDKLISFLSEPEIDNGFCKPLSDRNISITERVLLKYKKGVWVIAEIEDQIVSCIAIVPNSKSVTFSTFACKNNIISKIAGGGLWEKSLKLVKENYDVSFINIDSWEGNELILINETS